MSVFIHALFLSAVVGSASDVVGDTEAFAIPIDVPDAIRAAPTKELERGDVLLRLGQTREAALAFRRVVAVVPESLVAHERLKDAAVVLGDAKAVQSLTALLCRLYFLANRLTPSPSQEIKSRACEPLSAPLTPAPFLCPQGFIPRRLKKTVILI